MNGLIIGDREKAAASSAARKRSARERERRIFTRGSGLRIDFSFLLARGAKNICIRSGRGNALFYEYEEKNMKRQD